MNNHYIPRLLLRPFAIGEHINTYNFTTNIFESKKLKNTFSEDDLFDEKLEKLFADKLEGPFGNLLNNKLLCNDTINLNRQENLLLRKFLMINFLRAPIVNADWDEMVEWTRLQEHPSVQAREFLMRHHPELKEEFEKIQPSADNYITNLRKVMEIDSLEDISEGREVLDISASLQYVARRTMASVIAFWDASNTEQEFILPKLPGITEMDYVSIFHKSMVINARRFQLEAEWLPDDLLSEIQRLQLGSVMFSENYSIYPISPTRCIACFSPYFRAFFPMMDARDKTVYPPLLNQVQFSHHFYEPLRMELFTPCKVQYNQSYSYQVKTLTNEELHRFNSIMLNMETEEFAFRDFDKICDSMKYYDNNAVFANRKKHDFGNLYK